MGLPVPIISYIRLEIDIVTCKEFLFPMAARIVFWENRIPTRFSLHILTCSSYVLRAAIHDIRNHCPGIIHPKPPLRNHGPAERAGSEWIWHKSPVRPSRSWIVYVHINHPFDFFCKTSRRRFSQWISDGICHIMPCLRELLGSCTLCIYPNLLQSSGSSEDYSGGDSGLGRDSIYTALSQLPAGVSRM